MKGTTVNAFMLDSSSVMETVSSFPKRKLFLCKVDSTALQSFLDIRIQIRTYLLEVARQQVCMSVACKLHPEKIEICVLPTK